MDTLPHEKKINEYIQAINHLKKQNADNPLFETEIKRLEEKLEKLKQKVYSELDAWERVSISRHPARPHTIDYIEGITDSFHELSGDRLYADDPSIIGGLATINGERFMLIGQEKGHDTESRLHRNFGMPNPEGYRKALRLFKVAEKFNLPIISLLDTPGAYPGLDAEERGQGWAIAMNLREMAAIKTPMIILVIGEGCSGGALGMGIGDVIGMLEHSYYSVISPEGCASILFRDATKNQEAAKMLKLNAENLEELSLVDRIVKEPLGGAHQDKELACTYVKEFVLETWQILKRIPPEVLVEQRYLKFREMGRVSDARD